MMTIEAFLLLALVLVYAVISYGHSPRESSALRQGEMNEEESQRRGTGGQRMPGRL
jgi:hypothetical protein